VQLRSDSCLCGGFAGRLSVDGENQRRGSPQLMLPAGQAWQGVDGLEGTYTCPLPHPETARGHQLR
jgi:hypothetical protein